jgi:hypothetical protein
MGATATKAKWVWRQARRAVSPHTGTPARVLPDAILDRFLHHAQTIAITGRSYRLKDHAAIAGKEDNS